MEAFSTYAMNEEEMGQPLVKSKEQLRLLCCAFLLDPGLHWIPPFIGRPGPDLQTDFPLPLFPRPSPRA